VVGLFPNEVAVIRLVGAILANTTVAAGDTAEEIDKLRRGGGGHIVVWGGVNFWRSLMRLDLIDEFRLDLYPMLQARVPGCSTVHQKRGIEARWAFPAGPELSPVPKAPSIALTGTVQRAHRRVQPAATNTSDLRSLAVTRQSSPSSSCSSCGSR
jgi:hypothetical protein